MYSAPALITSSLMIGTQVSRRPRAMPAETSTQPAWQMAATIVPFSQVLRTRSSSGWERRMASGAKPPGMISASTSVGFTSATLTSDRTG